MALLLILVILILCVIFWLLFYGYIKYQKYIYSLVILLVITIVLSYLCLSPKHLKEVDIYISKLKLEKSEHKLRLIKGTYTLKIGENIHLKKKPNTPFSLSGTITTSSHKIFFEKCYDPMSKYDAVYFNFDVFGEIEVISITLQLTTPEDTSVPIWVWCFPSK